jgi:O-antigen/teichoic acid export membrane protein
MTAASPPATPSARQGGSPQSVRIARHTAFNLVGLTVPLVVAFLLVPVITRELGPARFGLLGLAWGVLEYLLLFDIGLGRATVRFVADAGRRDWADTSQIASVSLASQLALGTIGGALTVSVAPSLVGLLASVPEGLRVEAVQVFRTIGLHLPVLLTITTLRGILEGAQRFDLSNAVKIPTSAAAVIVPAITIPMGATLPEMLLVLLAVRVAACVVLAYLIRRSIPSFRWELPRDWYRLRALLSFGGWVALSSVVSPLLVYLDRFMLASIVGLAATGYYVGAYEGVTRLLIIPASLVASLFPIATGIDVGSARMGRVFSSAFRILLVTFVVPLALLAALAPDFLSIWLRPEYAEHASIALRILAVGLVANALAHIPYSFLQAAGRPDLPAKFHMLELVGYVPLTWLLVSRYGVTGAAIAWSLRVFVDALLLFGAGIKVLHLRPATILAGRGRLMAASLLMLLGAMVVAGASRVRMPTLSFALLALSICVFSVIAWTRIIDVDERFAITSVLGRRFHTRRS